MHSPAQSNIHNIRSAHTLTHNQAYTQHTFSAHAHTRSTIHKTHIQRPRTHTINLKHNTHSAPTHTHDQPYTQHTFSAHGHANTQLNIHTKYHIAPSFLLLQAYPHTHTYTQVTYVVTHKRAHTPSFSTFPSPAAVTHKHAHAHTFFWHISISCRSQTQTHIHPFFWHISLLPRSRINAHTHTSFWHISLSCKA